jgi:hypothetical protein
MTTEQPYTYNPTTHCLDEVPHYESPANVESLAYQQWCTMMFNLSSLPCAKGTEGLWSAEPMTERNYEVIDGIAWPHPLNGYARGNYFCTCHNCKKQFRGNKRAVTCHDCAYPLKAEQVKEGEVDELPDIISQELEFATGSSKGTEAVCKALHKYYTLIKKPKV